MRLLSTFETDPSCRICGQPAGQARFLRRFAVREREDLGLFRCTACGWAWWSM